MHAAGSAVEREWCRTFKLRFQHTSLAHAAALDEDAIGVATAEAAKEVGTTEASAAMAAAATAQAARTAALLRERTLQNATAGAARTVTFWHERALHHANAEAARSTAAS